MPDERTDSISSQEFVNEAVLIEVREEPGKKPTEVVGWGDIVFTSWLGGLPGPRIG